MMRGNSLNQARFSRALPHKVGLATQKWHDSFVSFSPSSTSEGVAGSRTCWWHDGFSSRNSAYSSHHCTTLGILACFRMEREGFILLLRMMGGGVWCEM